ncbi:MAG: DegQ family serine endoprotease [Bdellovibrionales bacterium]
MSIVSRLSKSVRIVLILLIALAVSPLSAQARSGPQSFADLAERLQPAVVNISTTQMLDSHSVDQDDMAELGIPPGSPFEQFFKDFMEKQKGSARKQKATALGSGFIVDASGYIVTNYHVIQDADEITVILHDDTNLPAQVVGRDKKTDLAILKVESKRLLPFVTWGDSDKVRVGDWIIAIGDPYGLGGTVTAGIISARSRDINSGPYDEYLQTDASINRGNSGGPMFNMDGEVVGVNTAIFSPSGGSIGIGFAIPSSLAKNITDQLRDHGHIRRGWLGVHIQSVTQEIAEGLGMDRARGALVSSLTSDGPAAKAGLQQGDVIISYDGKEVPDMRRLPLMVAETEVDKTVNVGVFRKGGELVLKVKVGELQVKDEAEEEAAEKKEGGPAKATPNAEKVEGLGISVAMLTDSLRNRFGVAKGVKGAVVTNVAPDGLAVDQGIDVGDVIQEASQHEIKSIKDLQEQTKQAKKDGKPLLLLINRKDDLRFVAVPVSKKKDK